MNPKVKKRVLVVGGVVALGAVGYYLWNRSQQAPAPLPMAGGGGGALPQPKPQPKPPTVIQAGSNVRLTAPLTAHIAAEGQVASYASSLISKALSPVPAGTTIHIDQMDGNGTIYFQYGGRTLMSPVEEYSAVIA